MRLTGRCEMDTSFLRRKALSRLRPAYLYPGPLLVPANGILGTHVTAVTA